MTTLTTLPTELSLLAWSVILLFVYIMLQGQLSTSERGLTWNAGPRDGESKPLGPVASRAERALTNFQETYPAFIAAVLAVVVAERTGWWSITGAWVWLIARVVYLPLYVFGVPFVRSLVWLVSLVGIAMILVQLL